MKNEKEREYLFDSIGNIDDAFIDEALISQNAAIAASQRSRGRRSAVLLVATLAALSLLTAAGIGLMAKAGLPDGKEPESADRITTTTARQNGYYDDNSPSPGDRYPDEAPPDSDGIGGDGEYYWQDDPSMDAFMQSIKDYSFEQTNDPASLLENGQTYIVWSYLDGAYRYTAVEEGDERRRLTDGLEYVVSVPARDEIEQTFCLWVILPEGNIVCPFLEENTCTDFEQYKAEVYPDGYLMDAISDVLRVGM